MEGRAKSKDTLQTMHGRQIKQFEIEFIDTSYPKVIFSVQYERGNSN